LQSTGPLLVLLDLVMQGMTGFEVLSKVADNDVLATRHRYIVLSARPYSNATEIGPRFAELLQRLNVPFIEKPFDLDDLLRTVRGAYSALLTDQRLPDSSQTA
jgi:CheY-like chemotaxis protein